MDLDLDPFDDVLLEPALTNARAGGKFQPKAKPKPRNIPIASVPVVPQSEAKGNSHAPLPNSIIESGSLQPVAAGNGSGCSFSLEVYGNNILEYSEGSFSHEKLSLEAAHNSPASNGGMDSMDALHVEAATFGDNGDYSHSYSKVTQETESVEIDLDHLDGVPLKPCTTRRFGKFQPKVNPQIRKEIPASVSSCLATYTNKETATIASTDSGKTQSVQSLDVVVGPCLPVLETDTLAFVSNDSNGLQENLVTQNNASSSALTESNVASQHPVTCSIHIDDGTLESEAKFQESRAFSNLQLTDIFSDSIVASDSRTRKFQPELKSRDGVESVVTSTDAQFGHSETMCINESSIPAFQSDDVLDYSSISFGDFTTSELPTNEVQANIAQTSCPQDANVVHLEDAHEEPEDENSKNRERKAASASNQINEGDASSRQLRKRAVAFQLIDEPEDEVGGLAPESPSSFTLDEEDKDYDHREDEDDNDNDNSGPQHSSQKDGMSKRIKTHVPEKEKSVRKRKRSDDAFDFPSQKPPRKFSHSTRRKKRLQELLALPENEIEFQRLPCKDIILLAGYREQLANNEAKAEKASQKNQSTEKSFNEEHSNNEEDTQGNSRVESTFTLFNSHSFIDKTPRIRWSKQDTELFYEGVRQFGTDLSMIQQLFPGRTRHQIKLKLKKEERQQPTRLYEALSNRPKDHSYFEKVIEQLQKAAAQAEEEFVRDESVSGTGKEEADLYSENNDDAGKSENDNDAAVEDEEVNTFQVHSPVKSDENDDDLDIWSSYRSDF